MIEKEETVWEDEGGTIIEEPQPAKGTVQSIKDLLADKEISAQEATPDGMEFIGWELNGWLAPYTLIDDNARPVYAFPRD